jgi:hypothetical protein
MMKKQIAQNQNRPAVSNNVERARDGAAHGIFSCHPGFNTSMKTQQWLL